MTGSDDTVDPVMLEFVERVLDRAESDDFDAVVFELDTPGGLSTSMDDIVKRIVDLHGGSIEVVTGDGGGAIMTVRLKTTPGIVG